MHSKYKSAPSHIAFALRLCPNLIRASGASVKHQVALESITIEQGTHVFFKRLRPKHGPPTGEIAEKKANNT